MSVIVNLVPETAFLLATQTRSGNHAHEKDANKPYQIWALRTATLNAMRRLIVPDQSLRIRTKREISTDVVKVTVCR